MLRTSIHQLKYLVFRFNQWRINKIIEKRALAEKDNFFFFQIGSNDGLSGDVLHEWVMKYGWGGMLLEPIPSVFERLKIAYKGCEKLLFENVAIDVKSGKRKLWYIHPKKNNKLRWFERIGSFSQDHVLKHKNKIPDFDSQFTSADVQCLTSRELLMKYDIRKINLLQIDAEGYDYEILKAWDFSEVRPDMVWYENKHLTLTDKRSAKKLLRSYGYHIIKAKDTFAFLSF